MEPSEQGTPMAPVKPVACDWRRHIRPKSTDKHLSTDLWNTRRYRCSDCGDTFTVDSSG